MHSILDIDLDYFNRMERPARHLEELLTWANCPVSAVVERHNHAFARWKRTWQTRNTAPSYILHVDEHHDMMDERKQTNIANFMCHAVRIWPRCRVHWLVQDPIDSPAMWLEEETWDSFRCRFSHGPERPQGWPRPGLVSVCTSPGLVDPGLTATLMSVVSRFTTPHRNNEMPNKALMCIVNAVKRHSGWTGKSSWRRISVWPLANPGSENFYRGA